MLCLSGAPPAQESLVTSRNSLSAEGTLMSQDPLAFLLAPRALMPPVTSPSFILSFKVAFALYSRSIPSIADPP